MNENDPPRDASPIVAQVTDPGRRLSMPAVILKTLEYCRLIHDRFIEDPSAAKQAIARRHKNFGVQLLRAIRDSEFPEDEEQRIRVRMYQCAKKDWFDELTSLARLRKRALPHTLVAIILRICKDIYRHYTCGKGKDFDEVTALDPKLEAKLAAESRDFAEVTTEFILNSLLSEEEKDAALLMEWSEATKPDHLRASEAVVVFLCKVLRESFLHQLEIQVIADRMGKLYLAFSAETVVTSSKDLLATFDATLNNLTDRIR